MPFRPKALKLAVLVLLGVSAAPAGGQSELGLDGTYVRDEAASDTMEEVIDAGLSKLDRVYRVWPIRGQARKRLESINRPHERIQIVFRGQEVVLQSERYTLSTPCNGEITRWERRDGEFVDVTTVLQGSRLEQRFVAEDGERVNVYSLSPDGHTLNLDVTITSPKLNSPLSYRQVYRRSR